MEYYGYVFEYGIVVWMAMFLYGTCMEVFVWILVVPFLGFSEEFILTLDLLKVRLVKP